MRHVNQNTDKQTSSCLEKMRKTNKQKLLIQIYLDFKFLNGIFTDYWNGSQLNFFRLYLILIEYIYVTGTKTNLSLVKLHLENFMPNTLEIFPFYFAQF